MDEWNLDRRVTVVASAGVEDATKKRLQMAPRDLQSRRRGADDLISEIYLSESRSDLPEERWLPLTRDALKTYYATKVGFVPELQGWIQGEGWGVKRTNRRILRRLIATTSNGPIGLGAGRSERRTTREDATVSWPLENGTFGFDRSAST
ncbi:hypothetical protein BV25DRAFT_1843353 [Artomyces pyxidatus]|uniref:Uncharacterized protein n=1 Tax=Artomyces pyxidatus TaxID=48021 RepID=A0ACB8SF61_9AGAM|nr:hypothetical protein BV25DRAFT_1843353 [Artomyces pyxidatus]